MFKRLFTILTLLTAAMLAGAQSNLWPNPGFESWNPQLDLPGDTEWQWTYRDLNRKRSSFEVPSWTAAAAPSSPMTRTASSK